MDSALPFHLRNLFPQVNGTFCGDAEMRSCFSLP
jgi:hypothetical protein